MRLAVSLSRARLQNTDVRVLMMLVYAVWANAAAGQQDTTSYGIHGMVLLRTPAGYVASHMPLHDSMHAHQVVFEVGFSTDDEAVIDEVFATSELVTLEPEAFHLHRLMQGELREFRARLVDGHFERGGRTVRGGIDVTVGEQLLSRALAAEDNGHYQFIPLAEKSGLLVHRIGTLPSFDHILWATAATALEPNTAIKVRSSVPATAELSKDSRLLSVQPLYLETRDFSLRE